MGIRQLWHFGVGFIGGKLVRGFMIIWDISSIIVVFIRELIWVENFYDHDSETT